MTSGEIRFEGFVLDPGNRTLQRNGVPVALNARYLDALALLARERGRLVSKERFHDEVWRGVPVTDEALTQCIRTLRRALDDSATVPRFIETVPKHGYRFIAMVDDPAASAALPITAAMPVAPRRDWKRVALLGGAGTIGGGMAGLAGGLFYGLAGTSQPLQPGMGAASVLLVLVCVTIVVALTGAAGVAFGIAAARLASPRPWGVIAGGAIGGFVIGGLVKLLGIDAFNLLLGQSPGDITGAAEGAVLGGAVGLGAWFTDRAGPAMSLRRRYAVAASAGGIAGLAITLLGGRLMAGSLNLLARQFSASRLSLDRIGQLFGETGFGPVSQMVTAVLEGALFSGCIVGAMILARRDLDRAP